MTINQKKLYFFMSKAANRAYKIVDKKQTKDENADLIWLLFLQKGYYQNSKKLINHEVSEKAEDNKNKLVKNYIKDSRVDGRYIYLASSHGDCAKDHIPYQGRLYYDDKAPAEIIKYAKKEGLRSIQWVMDSPAWFITRPNCRHYFKSLPLDVVEKYDVNELKRRYKTNRKTGDRDLATPRKIAIEEYEDRLRMLRSMYKEHPTEHLRREIQKTELLVNKWKNKL